MYKQEPLNPTNANFVLFSFSVRNCNLRRLKPGWPNSTEALTQSRRAFQSFMAHAPAIGSCFLCLHPRAVSASVRVHVACRRP